MRRLGKARFVLLSAALAAIGSCSGREATVGSGSTSLGPSGAGAPAAGSGGGEHAHDAGHGGSLSGEAGRAAVEPNTGGAAAAAGTGSQSSPETERANAGATAVMGAAGSQAGAQSTSPPSAGASAPMSAGSAASNSSSAGAGSTAFHACPTAGAVCKIMPFGDSITDGFNADTPGGYRVELFRLAHSAGKKLSFVGSAANGPDTVDGVAFPRDHEGHSGWTIAPAGGRSGISTLVEMVMPKYKPDIVLLMIGTNDAIDNYEMTQAPARLERLIDAIYAQLPNVLIVVAQLIPARGDASKGDDTALNARISSYNAAIPGIVKARADAGRHILSVDMYTQFAREQRSLFEDQWHPNAQGYTKLGAEWYAAVGPQL